MEIVLDEVKLAMPVSGPDLSLVTDVVYQARKGVDSEQVTAEAARQEPGGNREVLTTGLGESGTWQL